jgi:enamine deaminase RidA (YjgF/YER057c/UK114 family)
MQRRHVRSGSPYEERYGFARGVRVGDRVEIAGTAPIPAAGDTVATTAFGQMLRCGAIAVAALEGLGATVADVVRTRMFITDPSEADEIGRAHREIFGQAQPASTMVAVAALLDPQWKVEIEVEAVVMERPS